MADETLNYGIPPDGGSDGQNAWLCDQSLYLAERVSDRGGSGQPPSMAQAYEKIQDARRFANSIVDNGGQAGALARCNVAQSYVSANEAKAPELVTAASASDASYVSAQKLNEGQLLEAKNEQADLNAALDARKKGLSTSIAYNQDYVAREVAAPVGQLSGAVANVTTKVGGSLLGPWKWYLLGAGVVALVVGGAYLYTISSSAKASAGAAGAAL